MIDINALRGQFKKLYGSEPSIYFAPGSVNIIGEHTDYNGGFVLPCAINFGICLAIAFNDDQRMRFQTNSFNYKADISLSELNKKQNGEWVNYPLGILDQFVKRGVSMTKGIDMLFDGDIPESVGLTSSASMEMVTAVALNDLFETKLDKLMLVKMSEQSEDRFVEIKRGIMGPFVVAFGEKNTALYLNCRTLDFELIPLNLKNHVFVVMNSNKRSNVVDSKYKERISECKQALEALRTIKPYNDLSELTPEEFDQVGKVIIDPILYRRARHVISENNRVKLAVSALQKSDFNTLGQLMNDSHESLRHDYQITGAELDTLVNAARKIRGVLGASMTGTGLGGCALVLVEKRYVEALINKVGHAYESEIGRKAIFYLTSISDGASIISEVHQQLP
ncbi:MAG: galactokinase [Omnitrophica WOR_2 bacterium]|jgi:galactokinase